MRSSAAADNLLQSFAEGLGVGKLGGMVQEIANVGDVIGIGTDLAAIVIKYIKAEKARTPDKPTADILAGIGYKADAVEIELMEDLARLGVAETDGS